MDDLLSVTLDDQIAEIEREIAMRRRVYSQQIANRLLTRERAERQMSRLQAVLNSLVNLRNASPETASVVLGADVAPPFQLRRSGRTSKIIQALPDGALFIVCSQAYVREIDRMVRITGKREVLVISIEELDRERVDKVIRGRSFSAVVLDHDVRDLGLGPDHAARVLELIAGAGVLR